MKIFMRFFRQMAGSLLGVNNRFSAKNLVLRSQNAYVIGTATYKRFKRTLNSYNWLG